MKVTIKPSVAHGTVVAPPSKSMAHRLLLCAGLADGCSRVRGLARSEDILATLDGLSALGARVSLSDDGTATVVGFDPARRDFPAVLPCRESGSTLRFLIPVAALSDAPAVFTGSERLLARPTEIYRKLFTERSLAFDLSDGKLTLSGPLCAGWYRFPGSVSSQFVSGLLFALPLADGESRVELLPPVASRPYIDMTLDALARSGIRIKCPDENVFVIPGNQRYAPGDTTVEGDWSNAAALLAFNYLGGTVSVTGLNDKSRQGDRLCVDFFKRLAIGCPTIDLSDCPDLGPILFAAAALLHGATFTGTARLREKESDRVAVMVEELAKCGVPLDVGADSVTVPGDTVRTPASALCSHNDHRIVMALCVLLSRVGGTLEGVEAVRKSYPGFFPVLKKIGIEVFTDGMDM